MEGPLNATLAYDGSLLAPLAIAYPSAPYIPLQVPCVDVSILRKLAEDADPDDAAVTVSAMFVLADSVPVKPFTVSEYVPGATLAATLMLTLEEALAGFVPNVPLMPVGHPDAASVTPELKPFAGITVTVDVPVDPAFAVTAVEFSVKFDAGGVPLTGPKKIALATALPTVAASLMVTLPLIFHTPY